jgi:hypothetical protein
MSLTCGGATPVTDTGYTFNHRDCYLDPAKSEFHVALLLSADINTSAGGQYALAFFGAYDSLHGSGSSRTTVAGSYRSTMAPDAEVLSIDSGGRMFSQDATTGCIINGTIDPIDSHYDVYRVELTHSACQGALAALNGLPVKGLATCDAGKSPAEFFLALDTASSARKNSIVLTERRT